MAGGKEDKGGVQYPPCTMRQFSKQSEFVDEQAEKSHNQLKHSYFISLQLDC